MSIILLMFIHPVQQKASHAHGDEQACIAVHDLAPGAREAHERGRLIEARVPIPAEPGKPRRIEPPVLRELYGW